MSRWRPLLEHVRLGPMTAGARHGLTYLTVLVILVIGGAYYLSARSVNALRAEIRAECKLDADIGTAPIIAPKGLKPSLLGVTIVADYRLTWYGHHCAGHLPPAAPSFVHWARYYHLPYK